MAITTDSYYDIINAGITLDRIGLSKTLDNYTIDDIKAMTYCGATEDKVRYMGKGLAVGSNYTMVAYTQNISGGCPYITRYIGGQYQYPQLDIGGTDEYNYPDGLNHTVLWLYRSSGTYDGVITPSNESNYKIITEWDAPKYTMYITYDNTKSNIFLIEDNISVVYNTNRGAAGNVQVNAIGVPYIIFEHDEKVFFMQAFYFTLLETTSFTYINNSNNSSCMCAFRSYTDSEEYGTAVTMADLCNGDNLDNPATLPAQVSVVNYYNYTGHTMVEGVGAYVTVGSNTGLGVRGISMRYFYSKIEGMLLNIAGAGLYFNVGNKEYKPIISSGWVIDYTDDLGKTSDIDGWSGSTKHTVPPSPPGPTPPGPGYDDDPWNGATFAGVGVGGAGAFAKVYYMTSTELANLRSWMNSINVPEGFDPMQQIIGLSQVPVALSGDAPENVVFVNSSAVYDPGVTTRAVDTGVATQQAMGTPISYYLGSVDIVRRMQERGEPYLDYDCQIELYLPLIGMFSLDTQAVMGRTISAYAVLDPVSGTLAAYAYVTKDGQNLPIAYGSTTIGVDLPISAQQLSVSRAALKQANAQLGASLLSGALTMLAAASSSGKSSGSGAKTSTGSNGLFAAGIREAGSDYMKASQVGNVFGDFMNWGRTIRQLSYGNNTAVSGSFGGSTAQWSYPFTPYVKIIRPRYEKPSNYAHSQGVPCVQTKTIGSCTGFIQCIGADVSGITGATDLELQAIQAALSNGIYAGGGQ